MQEKLNFTVEETEKGIRLNIEPKDASKTESFKKFVAACKDFSDCDC